jgi:hypothetical protein
MTQAQLNQILEQLETLAPYELCQLYQVIQTYIANREQAVHQAKFHQALLTSGLIQQLKQPSSSPVTQRRLVQVDGKPISETIIEERR